MTLYAPGFLAKSVVENIFYRSISKVSNCLYFDRENSKIKMKYLIQN